MTSPPAEREPPKKCPKCGSDGPFVTVPRLMPKGDTHLFQVGDRCLKCGAEFGFPKD